MNKMSALIIDDSETDRYLVRRYLTKLEEPCLVFESEDGEEALEFFRKNSTKTSDSPEGYPPHLIFLDINMPKVNGFEFLKQFEELRNEGELQTVVVMMLTSSGLPEEKERALSYDFVKDYITKGQISSQLLQEKIKAHCF